MSIKIVFEDEYIKKALQANVPWLKYEEIDIDQYSDEQILDSLDYYIQGDYDIEYEHMKRHDIIAKVERVKEE